VRLPDRGPVPEELLGELADGRVRLVLLLADERDLVGRQPLENRRVHPVEGPADRDEAERPPARVDLLGAALHRPDRRGKLGEHPELRVDGHDLLHIRVEHRPIIPDGAGVRIFR
jgi:hypothetical protein